MSTKKPNPTICVDFDGVIHSYTSGWRGIDVIPDPPVTGAIEWLLLHLPIPEALGMSAPYVGPEVVIYSSRSKERKGLNAMRKWLIENGVNEWYFKDDILKFPTQKPAAFLTIDDRAICFDGRFPTSEEMMAFQPWYRKEFGATGLFPDGKLIKEDEGELRFGIAHDQDNVILNFGKPVAWLVLPPEVAKQLAAVILSHAVKIRP
jgi:hypothetical protein